MPDTDPMSKASPETDAGGEVGLGLSAVVPLYNEERSVAELVERLIDGLGATGRTFEIVLVDDGSTDGTARAIAEAEAAHGAVRGVFLLRNYGQSTALQAGFDKSRGRIVATLDGDLQNDPADIVRMLEVMERTGADLVSGWRKERKDGRPRVWASQVANMIISRITGVVLRDYGCGLKLYRRALLDHIRIYGEMHRFLPAILADVGARVVETDVAHHRRRYGQSKYGFGRIGRVLLDLILIRFLHRYMHRPLHLFGGVGLLALVAGGLISLYLTFLKLGLGESIGGRPLLLLGVFLMLIGIAFIGLGLIGELVIRVLHEPSGRRQYLTTSSPAQTADGTSDTPPRSSAAD